MVNRNPWEVENIKAFSFYCCPECDFKSKKGDYFKRHAMESHNKSKVFFTMSKSKNNMNDDDPMDVETESEYQDEKEGKEDFNESETSVKEESLSESEGEELVRLSEHQALKLINGPDYITQEDLETFDDNESADFVEDNVKTFDEQKSECNNTFEGENFENITDAEASVEETIVGMETYDDPVVEKTETFNVIEVQINDKNIAAYDVKQDLKISNDLESEGNIEKANTLVGDNCKITEEQKNVILVAFKGNEEKAKTFIKDNYNITEEEKNIILDAIRNNFTNEMATHKKEEVNLSEDNINATASNQACSNSKESPVYDENETQVVNEIPHEFIVNNKIHKQGPKKGESYQTVSLCVFPYMFRKRYKRKEITSFSCNGCEKLRKSVVATAPIDENKHWLLLTYSTNHLCSPSPTAHQKAEFSKKLYKKIALNPRASMSELYCDLKMSLSKDMDPDERKSYYKSISSFRNLQKGLYAYRSQFIPKNSDSMKESNLHPFQKYTCDDCKEPFEKKHCLELHINSIHLNKKPHMCNLCKKSFFVASQLKIHMKKTHK